MQKRDSVTKNYILQFLYQFIVLAVPLAVAPYLTRVLGKSNLGIYTYSYSIAYYFVILSMLGINRHGQRVIAANRDNNTQVRKQFWSLFSLHIIISLVSIFIYILYICFFVNDNRIVYLILTLYVVSSLFDITWFFQGLENFQSVIIRNTVVKIVECILIFIFVKTKNDLWIYTLIASGGVLVGQLAMLPKAIIIAKPIRFSWEDIRPHIKPLFILALTLVASTLYTVFDKTLLGVLASVEDVAIYEYSNRIISISVAFITVIGTVLYPRACKMVADKNIEGQRRYFKLSTLVTSMLGCALAFGLLSVAEPLAFFYYGSEFSECGYAIKYMTPLIIIISLGDVLRTQYMIPKKMDGQFAFCLCINAVINLILTFLLIPLLGIMGAIIGTTAAELFGFCFQMHLSKEITSFKEQIISLCPFVVIGLIMYFIILLFDAFVDISIGMLILEIIIGGIVYISLSSIYIFIFQKQIWLIIKGKIGRFLIIK